MMLDMTREARTATLAGTRMLILETTFDALVDALIQSGAIPQNAASVMLEYLAERFIAHSAGTIETEWAIDKSELMDQAARLKTLAASRAAPASSARQ